MASQLYNAIKHGDTGAVEYMIAHGADVNGFISDGEDMQYPLIVAAQNSRYPMIRLLLDNGADVNISDDEEGETALIWASERGMLECVRELCFRGADVNHFDNAGWNALIWASAGGNLDVVRELCTRGALVNAVENDGDMTALMAASVSNQLAIVRELVDRGADINMIDSHGQTAADMASTYEINRFLKGFAPKKVARNLQSVGILGSHRGLPENVEGGIGSFISGKRGNLSMQMDEVQQNAGISLARQPRRRARRGGKRTMKKKRKGSKTRRR